jgi:phosphatidylserine/phosphatidylglycerophosphate/cardiolipin synthase-like enzyme
MCPAADVEQSIVMSTLNLDQAKAIQAQERLLGATEVSETPISDTAVSPPITEKSERIAKLEQELAASTGRPIYNYEHRQVLEKTLKLSLRSVFIISPWVKRIATDDQLLGMMRGAMDRGVNIAIGYGMPSRHGDTEEYMDPDVEAALTKLQKRNCKGSLHVERLAGTHEKIIVSDEAYCVVTSFNWLSYRGDRGFRNETGILLTAPKIVRQIRSEAESRFRNLPAVFAM